jgi:hypothetical protein
MPFPVLGVTDVVLGQSKFAMTAKGSSTSKLGYQLGADLLSWGIKLGGVAAGAAYMLGEFPGQPKQYRDVGGIPLNVLSPAWRLGAATSGAFYGTMTNVTAQGLQDTALETQLARDRAQLESDRELFEEEMALRRQTIFEEQRARYEANLQYPTFPIQESTKTSDTKKYIPKIL